MELSKRLLSILEDTGFSYLQYFILFMAIWPYPYCNNTEIVCPKNVFFHCSAYNFFDALCPLVRH